MTDIQDSKETLWKYSAFDVVQALRNKDISPEDLLDCLEARITKINPIVNALPTLCFDRARNELKKGLPKEKLANFLYGLPIAIKDATPVSGVKCTYGSEAYKDYVPEESDAVVGQIEKNGGVVYAKSNTPEFEAGANTFNKVFGTTKNPWNIKWSAGGSSGGSAVAVATGMAWLAQGADFACSLRNPAAFSGVVGLRPSVGLVPQGANHTPFQSLSVNGPIARNVVDCGLFLDAMCGGPNIDPFAKAEYNSPTYLKAALSPSKPERVAFSLNLGLTTIDKEVSSITVDALKQLGNSGVEIVETNLKLSHVHSSFRTLRALQFASAWGHILPEYREVVKSDVVWNIEEGQNLTACEIIQAERNRAIIRNQIYKELETHTFLILPTSIVPPFPIDQPYVKECEGEKFNNYLEWMSIAYVITLAGCPAISIPAGYTSEGKPVGVQIVARNGHEEHLLSFAAYFEKLLGYTLTEPINPREN